MTDQSLSRPVPKDTCLEKVSFEGGPILLRKEHHSESKPEGDCKISGRKLENNQKTIWKARLTTIARFQAASLKTRRKQYGKQE